MKDKIVKILTNKWFHAALSFVLTLLIILQEVILGTDVSVWLGLIFSAVFGVFAELFRWIAKRDGYKIVNVLPWLIGGFVACLIMAII